MRLIEQIDHLEASAIRFDQGQFSEANRLAVAVRVLVYDRGAFSRSIYQQLGVKESLKWLTADRLPPDFASILKFTMVNFTFNPNGPGSGIALHYVPGPEIIKSHSQLDFNTWWTNPVMAAPDAAITRADIVKALANQDGGAHVDLTNALLRRVLRSVPLKIADTEDDGISTEQRADRDEEFARTVMRVAMRTIAEEVRLGYLNQLDIVDPEKEITRPRPASPQKSRSGGPDFERPRLSMP